jgi:16S rRNA (cytidine1402-2'-O)-methyltransferase
MQSMSGILYVVATPIGNLEDLTLRAIAILKEVDIIACEDTRVTKKLLSHLGIQKPMFALHEHSGLGHMNRCIDELRQGKVLAYVSDAGTPGVNDPGGKFVERCFKEGIRVEPIPGPSALTAAISVCGFPMDEFTYVGFLPHKKGKQTMVREMSERKTPTMFFESTHRILPSLETLRAMIDPMRYVFIGRELTKMHETLYRGTIDEVIKQLQATSTKGEFVVIVGPKK